MTTNIHIENGTLNWNNGPLASLGELLDQGRDIGSVWEALSPGEIIRLRNGCFVLDEDLFPRHIIRFRDVNERNDLSIVEFSLPNEGIEPGDIASMSPPAVDLTKGVVLSGRGPIWLFCALAHHYHPALWVGTHDPRIRGAVVVECHSVKGPRVGTLLNISI